MKEDILQWLYDFTQKTDPSSDPSLNLIKIKSVLEELGNPQFSYKIIHIAGTSGKGTTARMLSYLLNISSQKVGLILSPHIVDIRERCMIDNDLISNEDFERGVNTVRLVIDLSNQSFSFFEVMILIALVIFKQQGVTYAVIETGLGGRLDTTNVLLDKISVVTSIGLDHTDILGSTLDKIAYEKTMIVHRNNHCFSYRQSNEIDNVIENVVHTQGGILHRADIDDIIMDNFRGIHNVINASLANEVMNFIKNRDGIYYDQSKIRECPPLLGRYTKKVVGSKTIVYDGAHNIQKITALVNSIKEEFMSAKFVIIFACKENKDLKSILFVLEKITGIIIITSFGDGYKIKSLKKEQIESILCGSGINYVYEEDNQKAFEYVLSLPVDNICITGSFYLVSELLPKCS